MLGWEVFVYRHSSENKELVAHWKTSVFGLEWLKSLVRRNQAAYFGGNGYPDNYSITAGVLLPIITAGLPAHDSPLVVGHDYVLPEGWSSDIDWSRQAVLACQATDLLTLEAWDMS